MEVQNHAERFDSAANLLNVKLRDILLGVPAQAKRSAMEIRIRVGSPVAITCPGQIWFLGKSSDLHNIPQNGYLATKQDIADSIITMCEHSVHTHQHEMKNGFISLRGGHRAGLCGSAVLSAGEISAVRDVTSINLRIAREIRGAANDLVHRVFNRGLCGALIAGIPSSGKTTLLRDLARQLSSGKAGRHYKVAVVDERYEIGAVYNGAPQNYLGPACDILSGYPKGEGIITAVRTLSPDVIICDEIGMKDEVDSIIDGLNCGVKIIASAHASSIEELCKRRQITRLIDNGAFKKIVMLGSWDKPGQIQEVVEVGEIGDKAGRSVPYNSMFIDDGDLHGVGTLQKSTSY